jgi:hypothetical protein
MLILPNDRGLIPCTDEKFSRRYHFHIISKTKQVASGPLSECFVRHLSVNLFATHIFWALYCDLSQQLRYNCTVAPAPFHIVPTTNETFILSWDKLFYSLLAEVRVLCY